MKLYVLIGFCVFILSFWAIRKAKNIKKMNDMIKLSEELREANYRARKTENDAESEIQAIKTKAETEVKLAQIKNEEAENLNKADNSAEFYNEIIEGFNK